MSMVVTEESLLSFWKPSEELDVRHAYVVDRTSDILLRVLISG